MDRSSFEDLLKQHHRDAFIWARQCCRYDAESAKEVLQMVYLKILEEKAVFGEQASFKTWLFSVIRFTAIDYFKEETQFTGLEDIPVIHQVEANINHNVYEALLSKLPHRQGQVLLLAFYHNMTLAEIAEVTGLHIGTVRTHYERGKQTLRELISKEKVRE